MKVALVSEHASPLAVLGGVDAGGQNVHVAALAAELAKQGAEVTVYTRRDDAKLPQRFRFLPGVIVEHVDAGPPVVIPKDQLLPHMGVFATYLLAAWGDVRPGLIHSHFWMSGKASLAAARELDLPVVHTFHALGIEKKRHQGNKDTSPPSRLADEAAIARDVDRIIATASQEVFELLRQGADPRKVRLVPCGVDLDLFSPDGPREARNGRPRIVVVSRLVERKGIADVIRSLRLLPGAELIIAGGPPAAELMQDAEARRLLEIARQEGVAERVQLRGRLERKDVPTLMRSADVIACVPWYEPFGIVPLEAMACGVPVVASAVGGLIDTVVHGVTGLHVPPKSPERVAQAVALLLDDALRRELGAAAAARVRGRYGWSRIASDTLEIYQSLLQQRAPRVREVVR